MTTKERELLLLLARETTWRRPEYQACLNLAREIEAEAQPAPDPQASPAAKSLDEAIAGLPVIGALHSVGGPGSGVFAAGPLQGKASSTTEPTPEDEKEARKIADTHIRADASRKANYANAIASALASERRRTAEQRDAELAALRAKLSEAERQLLEAQARIESLKQQLAASQLGWA